MGCCGQNRGAWRATPAAPPGALGGRGGGGDGARGRVITSSTDRRGGAATVRLRWRRAVTATVTGPVTGARYAVSAAAPGVVVDTRDAADLLATGFFARLG